MFIVIATILFITWFICLVSGFTMGGLIHVLLAAAIVSLLLQTFRGGGDAGGDW
jgi:hypothetical protein